mmetsp:Transcript_53683/g.122989  ORF Transcript_53683/g.122989 Transcript_53683/m.122989 type:complete len:798 (+) Transcript_53683:561-2954(+)
MRSGERKKPMSKGAQGRMAKRSSKDAQLKLAPVTETSEASTDEDVDSGASIQEEEDEPAPEPLKTPGGNLMRLALASTAVNAFSKGKIPSSEQRNSLLSTAELEEKWGELGEASSSQKGEEGLEGAKAHGLHLDADLMDSTAQGLGAPREIDHDWVTVGNVDVCFPPEEADLLIQYFEIHDVDGDEVLDMEELKVLLRDMGKMPRSRERLHELEVLLRRADAAGESDGGRLQKSEFLTFMVFFYDAQYRKMFDHYDKDRDGTISMEEIVPIVRQLSDSAEQWCTDAQVREAMVSHFGKQLAYRDFCRFMQIFRQREFEEYCKRQGFSHSEVDEIADAFKRVAYTNLAGKREVDATCLVKMLQGLGRMPTDDEPLLRFLNIIKVFDKHVDGCYTFLSVLRILRLLESTRELSEKHIIAKQDGDGEADQNSAPNSPVQSDLQDEEEVGKVELQVMAMVHGCSPTELQVLYDIFCSRDEDGSGDLSLLELRHLVEDLGLQPKNDEQREIFARVLEDADRDGDKSLHFNQFVTFLNKYFKETYHQAFVAFDSDGSGTLNVSELATMVYTFGYQPPKDSMQRIVAEFDNDGSGDIDEDEFQKIMAMLRGEHLQNWQERAGFSDEDVARFKAEFEAVDADGSGCISLKEFTEFLAKIGRQPATKEHQQKLLRMFRRKDQDNTETLDIQEFLQLLREWANEESREVRNRELDCAEQAGYTEEEVEEFRVLFKKADSGTSPIGADEIIEVFRQFRVALKQHRDYIKILLEDFSPRQFWFSPTEPAVHFPEFLLVLKAMQDAKIVG